jgi:hypothetical protein
MYHAWGERGVRTEVLVGKPEGRRQLGRPRRRWEYDIKTNHSETGFGIKGPAAGYCEPGNNPSGSIKFWECLE